MEKAYRKANNMAFKEGEIRIMSIGPSGVGKSVIGNKLLELKSTDNDYLKTEASAKSCTQEPATVTSGKVTYTDVPGIPDTNPNNTKKFYNMIINEAKDPCTAIFFVFTVDMRLTEVTKNRIKQCALLFNEINNCAAAKILILNDVRAWNNPEGLDEDDEEYKDAKKIHDEVRQDAHKAYEKDIKKATGIEFYCTKVIYGLNSKINPDNNMGAVMKYLKLTLQSFPCDASPNLRTFEELEKEVTDAKKNQDYEQRLINEQKERINSLEESIKVIEITIASAGGVAIKITIGAADAVAAVAGAAGAVASFFTFGLTALAGAGAAAAATAAAASARIAQIVKEKELNEAKAKIDEKNLKAAVEKFEAQFESFEELKKGLTGK